MQITYKNKVTLQSNPNIPDENKVTAEDMNEIKFVVNSNEEEQQALTLSVQEIAQNVVNNSQEISNIKEEQTTQNDNIQTNSNNISDLQSNKADKNEIPTDLSQLSNDNTKFVNETGLENAISQEKTQRQNADNNLQNQVDTNKTNIQTNATNIATNTQEINTIKAEQTTQNTNIQINADNISALTSRVTETEGDISDIKQEQTEQNTNISTNATNIESLQEENDNLKKIVAQMPQVTGQGTEITLENTIEAPFTIFDVEGNSTQDGEPSPDNEVPIYSAGDNENLLPNNISTQTKNGIAITKNNDGTLTFNGTSTEGFVLQVGTVTIGEDGEYTLSGCPSGGSLQSYFIYNMAGTPDVTDIGNGKTKALNKNDYLNMYINIRANQTFNNLVFKPKLEKGNKASGYSPYGMGSINEKITNSDGTEEQDYSIFVQQPMRSIGDVRDCFVKKSDGWYERHYIGEVVFDGTENWQFSTGSGVAGIYMLNPPINDMIVGNFLDGLSNYFHNDKSGKGKNSIRFGANNNVIYIYVDSEEFPDKTSFTSWLAEQYANGTPVKIQYELAEPLDLPCTETQIQQLENKPSTYKDFTIIQSEDETPAYLEVSGIYDLNKLITRTEVLESES